MNTPINPPPEARNEAQQLAEALDFTAADLQRNREGYLSPRQLQRLRGRRQRLAMIFVGSLLVLILIGVLMTGVMTSSVNPSMLPLWVVLSLTPVGILIVILFMIPLWLVHQDVRRGVIHVAEIVAHVEHKTSLLGQVFYQLLLQHADDPPDGTAPILRITQQVAQAFDHGQLYLLYYTPSSRQLMSGESLDLEQKARIYKA